MALNIVIDPDKDTYFFDSVRRLLGGVDEETLSNDDILDPAFFDIAEIELLDLVPCLTSSDVSDTEINKAKLAMIHIVASKLCPTVKGRVEYEVKTIDVAWKKDKIKYDELQDELLTKADMILNTMDCYTGNSNYNIFVVAPSKRAVDSFE